MEWTLASANAALFQAQALLREAKSLLSTLQNAPTDEAKGEFLRVIEQFAILGIEVKSIEPGLLDFPALLGNREVLLCWVEGETEISHYHDAENGFAGRTKIPQIST